jgi:hypothetical protein
LRFASRKKAVVGRAFLLEVLGILVCFVVVKRGEFVVDCGANMDK